MDTINKKCSIHQTWVFEIAIHIPHKLVGGLNSTAWRIFSASVQDEILVLEREAIVCKLLKIPYNLKFYIKTMPVLTIVFNWSLCISITKFEDVNYVCIFGISE